MRKSRVTESQIVSILKESEAGVPLADLVRKHGISRATYFTWKSKYAGATVADLKRIKELETENAKLKRMYADLALENAAIKDVLSRTLQGRPRVVGLARATWYTAPVDPTVRDAAVIDARQALIEEHPRWGFWKCDDRLRLDGHGWNHKRLHRVYVALRLHLPRRTRRRVPPRFRQPLVAPTRLNEVWALDFIHDALYGGRRFRTLNVLDEGNREGLAIEVGTSLPATRVIRVLSQLIALYGTPNQLRLDNGPELTAQALTDWCAQRGIGLAYIQPGKPVQNAFIERFNRTYREEVLDAYLFHSTQEAQAISDAWLVSYNEHRPHNALGRVPPLTYLPRVSTPPASSYSWSA